ncbi:hypothetical protein JTE90_000810 [Oedothorax gibbosus]|uniref:Uncharacterized protein n=1 Tax=Oedothorax gibbosus TaxID=931172 RepID=A0AAV6TDN3_9ARAC|nr:hypothetical protein JTE90_000810 [Oedothorax gibbosus]
MSASYPGGNFGREPATRWAISLTPPRTQIWTNDCTSDNRYGPPPEFPLASSCPGIVHHLSGPNVCAQTPPLHKCRRAGLGAPARVGNGDPECGRTPPPACTFISPPGLFKTH